MCASLSLNAPLQVLLSDTPAHAHSSNIRYEMVDNSKPKNKKNWNHCGEETKVSCRSGIDKLLWSAEPQVKGDGIHLFVHI